jgi:transcription-repair coupling factor (superfamily II helicase)
VRDIQAIAARLQRIVPEARLEIAHGQMPEDRLEKVMLRFLTHQFDLLLATTIVESGLDIPNANTLFIDEADRYGLADLHQLRGRVGRYRHRAYCYLLVDPRKNVSPQAARRLRAIEEFSQMGAGFALAMRDLELRGAGNILGTEQSGYITAVGYELYCSLLDRAVRKLKRLAPRESVDVHVELPGEAHLPGDFVSDIRTRIDLYRRIAGISREADLDDLVAELVDRFGPIPLPAERYLALARLRIWAHRWKIEAIRLEPGFVVLGYSSRPHAERLRVHSGNRLRLVDGRSAYLPVDKGFADPDEPLRILESLLRPAS